MGSALKQQWRDFICTASFGGPYLSSIGSAVDWSSASLAGDGISDFLERLRGGTSDIRLLANAVNLLKPEYLDFVHRDLHRVLDHLSNEMIRVDEIVGPALRGNPRWDRTVIGRLTRQLPPGRYYSRTAHRSFHRPENSLLKWLVDDILAAIRLIGRRIGKDQLHPKLRKLAASCEEALRHHWFSGIDSPLRLDHEAITASRHHRRQEYRHAAELAAFRRELQREGTDGKWSATLALLSAGWLEPISEDDLFELYALAMVLEVLKTELGFGVPVEIGLVAPGRKHVAKFLRGAATIRVFFDQSPSETLGVSGKYRRTLAAHRGISGNEHRPDIIICLEDTSGQRHTLFVEVKNSESPKYLSDSLYKAFGYLYDFNGLWHAEQSNPRVVLLVPGDVCLKAEQPIPEVAFASGADRSAIATLLAEALGLHTLTASAHTLSTSIKPPPAMPMHQIQLV